MRRFWWIASVLISLVGGSAAMPALADGALQYWGVGETTARGKCLLSRQHRDLPELGRYSLYTTDVSAPLSIAENIPVYRSDNCTLYFDIFTNDAALDALLAGELSVQVEICGRMHHRGDDDSSDDDDSSRGGCGHVTSFTFADEATVVLDEPADTVLDEVWALLDADLGALQAQLDEINRFAPACGTTTAAVRGFDIGAATFVCTDPLATQATGHLVRLRPAPAPARSWPCAPRCDSGRHPAML